MFAYDAIICLIRMQRLVHPHPYTHPAQSTIVGHRFNERRIDRVVRARLASGRAVARAGTLCLADFVGLLGKPRRRARVACRQARSLVYVNGGPLLGDFDVEWETTRKLRRLELT